VSLLLSRTLIVAALAVFLAPVLWLLTTAYKPARDIFGFPPGLAFTPTLDNFRTIAELFDLPQLLGTSLLVSGGATVVALLMGVPAGYALARSSSRWAMGVAYLFLAVRMVPPVATLIPFYVLMRDFGLLGTPAAVILMHGRLSTTLVTWLMFGQFRALPRVLEEAAVTDGCSRLGAFLRIVLPLAAPGMIAASTFVLVFSWNEFLFAFIFTTTEAKTAPLILSEMLGALDGVEWGVLFAAATLQLLPVLAFVMLVQKAVIAGMTAGSVKG